MPWVLPLIVLVVRSTLNFYLFSREATFLVVLLGFVPVTTACGHLTAHISTRYLLCKREVVRK